MAFIHIDLPYYADSSLLFYKLMHLPGAVYLDSCQPHSQQGRYDIIAALPYCTISSKDTQTFIQQGHTTTISKASPFYLLQEQLASSAIAIENIPFAGGAIGYFAYDLARRLERLPEIAAADIALPEMLLGIYDWAIVVDHHLQKTALVSHQRYANTPLQLKQITDYLLRQVTLPYTRKQESAFKLLSTFQANFTQQEYATAFQRIQAYLAAGDCYQVNLAQRFSATYQGSTWQTYQQLRRNNAAPYAAYLPYQDATLLSLSPERFLSCRNGKVESKPIKGTRARAVDPQLDQQRAMELLHSIKDRAENLMIVDLLRNDLAKVCNNITVPHLFNLESFPAVHHLVSTVTGELAFDKDSIALLNACFPGGSITGAPKLRAMEIIEELEPQRRSVYCGAIGYIGFDGAMDVNIAIRTLIATADQIHCYAGGGIVADSVMTEEYQETQDKVVKILQTLKHCSA